MIVVGESDTEALTLQTALDVTLAFNEGRSKQTRKACVRLSLETRVNI